MIKKLLVALTGAPWWVYVLFVYLLWTGFQSTKPRTIWLPKIFIAPVIFISLFLANIFQTYGADPIALGLYLAAILVGIGLGWLLVRRTTVEFDQDKHSITLPGSYTNLLLFLSVFVLKYYQGYMETIHPHLANTQGGWMFFKVMSAGLIAGLMLGRNLGYLNKYLKS